MIARHVRLTGLVQGVFFRAWACEQAKGIGVAGWIRNCHDGSVEAHVEGGEEAVERMIGRLRQGPPHARVGDVKVEDATPEELGRFDIRH